MKAMIASACLATTVGLSGCTDKAYTGTACNALTTKEKVLNICKPPASAKQMNNGEMLTPRDVSFQKIDDTNALSMAEVLIAPGRTALFVVRFKKSDFYSPPRFIPERLQIFENGAFLSEKIFGSGPYALQKTAENFYKDSSV